MDTRHKFRAPVAELDQIELFPATLGDYVPEDHICRVIADMITAMDCSAFENVYEG